MTLEALSVDELNRQIQALEEESKLISKQIGAAKKSDSALAQELIQQKKRLQIERIAPLKQKLKDLSEPVNPEKSAAQPSHRKGLPERCAYPSQTLEAKDIEIVEGEVEGWDEYIAKHPQGSVYQSKAFLRAIHRSFGHDDRKLAAIDRTSAKIVGLMPLIEQKSSVFGHFWTSIPFVNYGGAIADAKHIEQKILTHAKELSLKSGATHLEVRGLYERPIDSPCRKEKVSMWLPLPSNSELLWSGFKAKLRSQIKRGLEQDIESKHGREELLDDFYAVFSRNMRDLGTPVYSKSLFRNILSQLSTQSHICIIYLQGQPAAAAFLIQDGLRMEIPWASTIRDYNSKNVNMTLYWHVLKFACEQQCNTFDFGRSTMDASTYRFKKQWGAQPVQHYWYTLTEDKTALPSVNPDNPKYRLLIAIWQKLPLWFANLIGPHVVKHIP